MKLLSDGSRRLLPLFFSLACVTTTQASIPSGTLTYTQRLGTAATTDDIEVWMHFTLGAASAPLHFASDPLRFIDPADLPTTAPVYDPSTNSFIDVPFAPGSIYRATLETWIGCQSSFYQPDCGSGPYAVTWGGWPTGETAFDLAPGDSIDYRLLTFEPVGGAVAPGTYRLPTVGLQVRFEGFDANGNVLNGYWGLASICNSGSDDCAFTRVVGQVSEPAPWLLALPLLALVTGRRFRSRH